MGYQIRIISKPYEVTSIKDNHFVDLNNKKVQINKNEGFYACRSQFIDNFLEYKKERILLFNYEKIISFSISYIVKQNFLIQRQARVDYWMCCIKHVAQKYYKEHNFLNL